MNIAFILADSFHERWWTMKKEITWKPIINAKGQKVKIPFTTCEKCEKEFSSGNTFASIYCPECAAEIKKEKTRDRVRKHRAKAKESAEE